MNLTFNMPVRVFFGENCVADHVDMLGSFGKKAMIISDPVSAKVTGAGDDIIAALEKNGIDHIVFDRVESNPTIDCVRALISILRNTSYSYLLYSGKHS